MNLFSPGLVNSCAIYCCILQIVQMIVGVICIVLGTILEGNNIFNDLMETKAPFWLGGVVRIIFLLILIF